VHFVGRDIPQVRFRHGLQPVCHDQLDWLQYAALVRTMDLGLSLMYTPHPSYPPLDLAASGAVAVTNRCGRKTSLERYSRNIICAGTCVDALLAGFETATGLIDDRERLQVQYRESGLLRDWRVSFRDTLDTLSTQR
jgi:hypothetical protein